LTKKRAGETLDAERSKRQKIELEKQCQSDVGTAAPSGSNEAAGGHSPIIEHRGKLLAKVTEENLLLVSL
jgi:hypothetical protein